MAQNNAPTHEIRIGNIRATIWTNESSTGEIWYSVSTSRIYQDDRGQWHDSRSFALRDLPTLASAVNVAGSWIEGQLERGARQRPGRETVVETSASTNQRPKRRGL